LLIYNGNNPLEILEETWVFGLGSIKDRTCVISFEQMVLKEFGGKREGSEEDETEENVQFLEKVVNHEICHTFGMRHCIYYECLMKGSNGYEEAFSKEEHLCPICTRKLQSALGFDFANRYEALSD
jgi:archaemetzincin